MPGVPSSSGSVQRLLETCARVELVTAAIYRQLADLHGAHTEMRRLWLKTADEEDNHAAQFRLAAAAYSSSIVDVAVTLDQTTEALTYLAELSSWITATAPSVKHALQRTIEMEERLASFHLDHVVSFASPVHRKLFAAMMAADRHHVLALQQALEALS